MIARVNNSREGLLLLTLDDSTSTNQVTGCQVCVCDRKGNITDQVTYNKSQQYIYIPLGFKTVAANWWLLLLLLEYTSHLTGNSNTLLMLLPYCQ